jgi:hypothetical protein
MDQQINKVCGIDFHKLFVFDAIMISGVEEPILKRFSTDVTGLLELRNWLKENDALARGNGKHWNLLENCILAVSRIVSR